MKRPLVILTAIFCLGIFFASKISICFALLYAMVLIFLSLAIFFFKKKLKFDVFLLCLVFLLGCAALKNSQAPAKCHISRYAYYKNNNLYMLMGFVDNEPLIRNNRAFFVFESRQIQLERLRYNCCGKILVYARGKVDYLSGDELILIGNLYWPYNLMRSQRQGVKDYLYRQGITAVLQAKAVRLTGKQNNGKALKRFALWSKARLESLFFKHTSPLTAGVLKAMVLGEKKDIPTPLYNAMVKSGTVHILPRLYTKMPSVAL